MNEYIKSLKKSLEEAEGKIEEIKEAISIMKEAGEQTATLDAKLADLITKRDKWLKALEAHGY